jgi:hypothetical protein
MFFYYLKLGNYYIGTTHYNRGGWFHWKDFRLNGGDCYDSYRIGPLLFRKYCKQR